MWWICWGIWFAFENLTVPRGRSDTPAQHRMRLSRVRPNWTYDVPKMFASCKGKSLGNENQEEQDKEVKTSLQHQDREDWETNRSSETKSGMKQGGRKRSTSEAACCTSKKIRNDGRAARLETNEWTWCPMLDKQMYSRSPLFQI